jgi:putative peptidoglycan lipid II flippase
VAGRGGYAAVIAAGMLLSRISGLVRERVFAHYFGNSPALGAFRAGLRIPNMLQNLLGDGVLSASFIPVYARLIAEKKEELAGRVAGVVAAVLALVVACAVLLGVVLSPVLVTLIAPGFEGAVRELTIQIVRILFPGTGILVLSAWCLGVLNSHRRFFVSYVAPVLWNAAMIATLVMFGGTLAEFPLAIALAWGMVAGAALQLGVQIPFVLRHRRGLRLAIDTTLEPVRQVFRNVVPVVMGRGVGQVSAFVDEIIISFIGAAAMASYGYASTIYFLPVSLFAMSVAAAELPEMSRVTGRAEEMYHALRGRLSAALRQVAFLVVPSTVAFVVIGNVLVAAVFETGRFGAEDTRFVWYVLAGFSVGLPAVTLSRVYSSTFYAMGDTRTPFRIGLVRVAVSASIALLLAFPLRPLLIHFITEVLGLAAPVVAAGPSALGLVGVTLASSTGCWVELTLLRRRLWKRLGSVPIGSGFMARLWIAAAAGAVAAKLAHLHIVPAAAALWTPLGAWAPMAIALVVCALFGGAYLAATAAFGVPQARALLGGRR